MASATIIEHILNLDPTTIFTTRDVLQYGTRSAVDQCLYRLVKSSFITRLARGMFVRDPNVEVTLDDIARIKAAAFGRQILEHATRILKELRIKKPLDHYQSIDSEDDNEVRRRQKMYSATNTYAIDGHSSRFQSCLGTVEYHGIAPRKRKLSDAKTGRRVYALWYFGDDDRIAPAVHVACRDLNRTDREDLRRASSLMPAWLHLFLRKRYAHGVAS
jgi:hypothetical protein